MYNVLSGSGWFCCLHEGPDVTQPIFLISLPRAGSTLLQKMLSVSPSIASAAEPWIMLPVAMMRDQDAMKAIYSSHTAAKAIDDFIDAIPDGEICFDKAMSGFARGIYSAAADGAPFFLDKTPRYYLIVDDLMRLFPEAKFIFLVRNPLAVLASIGNTFYKGRLCWFDYWVDWLLGHENMARAIQTANSMDNSTVVRYEELVSEPTQQLSRLSEWLGVPFSEDMLTKYRDISWSGKMGDPIGVSSYRSVSKRSTTEWQSFYASRFRKNVGSKMLDKIPSDSLSIMGYPVEKLKNDLYALPNSSGLDLPARANYVANQICTIVDYRSWKLRRKGKKNGKRYSCGRLLGG